MFVDRQSIFSCLLSLKLLTLSVEIRRFQAANIDKIKKTTIFLKKKVIFSAKMADKQAITATDFGNSSNLVNGDGGCCAGPSASV